nr:MAG TPA: hypothetical protein [Bacteriophage sp.]
MSLQAVLTLSLVTLILNTLLLKKLAAIYKA